MFLLFVNNQPVEFGKSAVNFILKSTIDILDGIKGSYAFNFSIPASVSNNELFNHPARLTKLDISQKSFDCVISFWGRIFSNGTVVVRSANLEKIELSISLSAGRFNGLIQDVMLPDVMEESINLGSETQDVIDHANNTALLNYPDTNHVFPTVYNDWLYGDPDDEDNPPLNPAFNGYINRYENDTYLTNLVTYGLEGNPYSLTPILFIAHIVKQCFNYFGYTVSGKVFDLPEISQLLCYNNFTLDLVEERFSYFGEASSYGFAGSADPQEMFFTENIQQTDGVFSLVTNRFTIGAIGRHDINIDFLVQHYSTYPGDNVFYEIEGFKNGVSFLADVFQTSSTDYVPYSKTMSIFFNIADVGHEFYFTIKCYGNDPAPDFNINDGSLGIRNRSQSELNRLRKTINYKDHVPNTLVTEFLNSFYLLTGTYPVFDHNLKSCKLISIADVLAGFPASDFSADVIKHSIKALENEYEGIVFSYEFEDEDEFFNLVEDVDIYKTVAHYNNLPSFPPVNSIVFVTSLNKYFKFVESEDQLGDPIFIWEFHSDHFPDHQIGNGKDSVKIKLSPLTMIFDPLAIYNVNVPAIRQKGSSFPFNDGLHEFGNRLFFWRGLDGISPIDFPESGSYDMDSYGTSQYGYDLRFDAQNGIVNSFWIDILNWYASRIPLEFKKQLGHDHLAEMLFNQIHRLGSLNILLTEASFKVDMHRIYTAKIKSWTL